MRVLAPDGAVFQGGTFSGNPACVAAAHALLDQLESDGAVYEKLNKLAERLAAGARCALAAAESHYPVVQLGSMVDFMFRSGEAPSNYAQAREADTQAYARYYWAMLERRIFLPPSPMEVMFLTTAHTAADVDVTIEALSQSLAQV